MADHSILVLPSANRVYSGDAPRLLAAELRAVDSLRLGHRVAAVDHVVRGGVPYVDVTTDGPLSDEEAAVWSELSSLYALFVRRDDGALEPVELRRRTVFDDDIVTIQRYPGKTNEQLTKLLLNLAVAASKPARARLADGNQVRVLDPLCGRGTTLNHALACGFDVWGVESEERDFDAYVMFLTTYLKDHRVKHKAETATMRRGRQAPGHRFRVDIRRGDVELLVDVVHDDTRDATQHFPKATADVLVTDLPYGVQHGAREGGGRARRPTALLEDAVPVWASLLRRGAAASFAWNTKTLARADLSSVLADGGFEVLDDIGGDGAFVHRVDHTITRDVLVAVRR